MATQKSNDPGSLSLKPSASAGGGQKKADFSNVSGKADTVPAGKDKAAGKADFSNGRGSADSVPADTQAGSYTVQKGDTLSAIAKQHYGKASHWNAIFEANRDQLDDPDLIKPGQVLKLPELDD